MVTGMCRCPDCGRWFFNWKKILPHRMKEHGFTIELPVREEEKGE